ncbi:type VI secretion protein VasK [Klebsiella aerogenes]|nr:type VI secretion protein VasK [Klebsiella aerogenes]
MADVRQSPLVALMNTLSVQGRTGQTGEAIADSLVKSAKQLFNRDNSPAIDQRSGARGPLDATFGPVLALLDNRDGGTPTSRLSLQTFLTRVTQVRLRLQQVTNATDPQAMTGCLRRRWFQGQGRGFNRNARLRQPGGGGTGPGVEWFWADAVCSPDGAGLAAGIDPRRRKVSTPSGAARWWRTGIALLAVATPLKIPAVKSLCRCWQNILIARPGASPAFCRPG